MFRPNHNIVQIPSGQSKSIELHMPYAKLLRSPYIIILKWMPIVDAEKITYNLRCNIRSVVIESVLRLVFQYYYVFKNKHTELTTCTYTCARSWHVYVPLYAMHGDWGAWRQQTLIHNETWNDNLLIKTNWSMCHLCFSFIT